MAKSAARKISSQPGAHPEEKVIVKKVPAFPIAAEIKVAGAPVKAKILKLTTRGLLAEVMVASLKMGDKCDISFEIPVLHHQLSEQVVVVKQYNQWQGKTSASAHLIEAHFVALSSAGHEKIASFLKALHLVD